MTVTVELEWRLANACRDRLHKLLEDELATILIEGTAATGDNWTAIMKTFFSKMDDEEILKDDDGAIILGEMYGSTATVVVVGVEDMVVAKYGDSRAVLFRGGIAMPLSTDHKNQKPLGEAVNGVAVGQGCVCVKVLALKKDLIKPKTVENAVLIDPSNEKFKQHRGKHKFKFFNENWINPHFSS